MDTGSIVIKSAGYERETKGKPETIFEDISIPILFSVFRLNFRKFEAAARITPRISIFCGAAKSFFKKSKPFHSTSLSFFHFAFFNLPFLGSAFSNFYWLYKNEGPANTPFHAFSSLFLPLIPSQFYPRRSSRRKRIGNRPPQRPGIFETRWFRNAPDLQETQNEHGSNRRLDDR